MGRQINESESEREGQRADESDLSQPGKMVTETTLLVPALTSGHVQRENFH